MSQDSALWPLARKASRTRPLNSQATRTFMGLATKEIWIFFSFI